jgi:hypothetical protein
MGRKKMRVVEKEIQSTQARLALPIREINAALVAT